MKIDINVLTELREKTGASVISVKKALEKAEGSKEAALKILQKEGLLIVSKKSERQTKAGVIDAYLHPNRKIGVLVEVLCETDFVAKNEGFQNFSHDIAMQVAASNPSDKMSLLEQPFIKNQDLKIRDVLNDAIAKFGEKIEIGRFTRFEI